MHRRIAPLLLLLIISAAVLAQQTPAKPNFTGIWNMDPAKSNFGGLDGPKSARYLIRQLGSKLELQYESEGQTTRVDVIPDGEERVLETGPDNENLARVYWQGAVLVFEGRYRPMAGSNAPSIKYTSRWSLSPDKKVLSIERHIATEMGNTDQKVVFEKQAAQAKAQ